MSQSGKEKKMAPNKKDMHYPNIYFENPIRKLYESPQKYNAYVSAGQVVADLGCGPGYFTIPLAECVGPDGHVYAVDTYRKAIIALEKKALKRGLHNIEMQACSAGNLNFIPDHSVDFILADGLLCTIAPGERDSAVSEMKRILKTNGKAYLVAGRLRPSYIEDDAAWEKILAGFAVEGRNSAPYKGNYWALVSLKHI